MRGNRSAKTMLLDEIDDPHGDYARAGAAGYDKEPAYPWTKEDVIKHENEIKGVKSQNAYPEQGSSSSDPRQELSYSSPPAGTSGRKGKGKRGVNAKKPRKIVRKRDLDKTDEEEDREDLGDRKRRSVKKKGKTTLVVKISLANSLHEPLQLLELLFELKYRLQTLLLRFLPLQSLTLFLFLSNSFCGLGLCLAVIF